MLNVMTSVYQQLSTIGIPVIAEGSKTINTVYPCISFRNDNDTQDLTGDTLGYSNIYYTVKI